jgi:hypothetical protein
MGMPANKRSGYPLCGAKKKNGEECRAFAGQGTDHLGTGKCKFHGGATRSHRKRAVQQEAESRMATLGASLDVRPDQALMGVLRATAGHVAWLATEVASLEGIDSPEAAGVVSLYGQERDRLARVAKACLDSGISKVEVEVAQEQTKFVAKAVNSALSSIGGLTNEQRKQFGEALRRELGQPEPVGGDAAQASVAVVPVAA